MSQHICNKCHKDLKYLSTLQRHQANKKDCTRIIISNNIVSNQSNTTASINIEDKEGSNNLIKFATNVLQDTINKAKTNEEKTILFNDFITLFNKNNSNQVLSLTNTSTSSNTSESINVKNVKNVCTDCNYKFSNRQGLHRHKTLNRCTSQNKLPITENIDNGINNTSNTEKTNSCVSL
jgi:transposase-like protein